MTQNSNRLLMMTAQSAIHAGAGSADEVIDQPVQRESASDWPCIYGSSMKGALRMAAEQQLEKDTVVEIFGPDIDKAHLHGGAMLISDARLLLLPVRSLNGHFKRVTCPALLRRWQRDMARMADTRLDGLELPIVEKNQLLALNPGEHQVIYLEEFDFDLVFDTTANAQLSAWAGALCDCCPEYNAEITETLVMVSNDMFRHLCRNAIPVQTRIRLENETKTVADGALWYEEYLAPETQMYCLLTCGQSHGEKGSSGDNLMGALTDGLFPEEAGWLQVGGNETVGMGWFRVQVVRSEEH